MAGVKAGCVHLCRGAGNTVCVTPVWQVTPCSCEMCGVPLIAIQDLQPLIFNHRSPCRVRCRAVSAVWTLASTCANFPPKCPLKISPRNHLYCLANIYRPHLARCLQSCEPKFSL